VTRRASLPGAAELFRPTRSPRPAAGQRAAGRTAPGPSRIGPAAPTGRCRHDEKITVYCSAEELLDLERARLALRADFGLVVDRGRLVREAVALVLADLAESGGESVLVRRLRED